jgi:hypothetical protein
VNAALGIMRDTQVTRSARVVRLATVFARARPGWRTAARDSILDFVAAKRVVVGTTPARAQAALQRRELGTNGKRQVKTMICEESPHHARVLFVQHPPKNAF